MFDAPEFRLLCACCYLDTQAWNVQRDTVLELLDRNPDPTRFVNLVRRHRLPVLTHAVLDRVARETGRQIPLVWMLQAAARKVRVANLARHAEWRRLQKIFAESGVVVHSLKGTALSERLYGDVAMRHTRDLDLLVAPEDLKSSIEVLRGAGYAIRDLGDLHLAQRVAWHIECESAQSKVELHWRFERVSSPRLEERWWELLRRGGPIFDLLYCCLHGSSHGWSRLKWVGDIKMLAPQVTPEVWDWALALNLRPIVAEALSVVEGGIDPARSSNAAKWLALPEKELAVEAGASRMRFRQLQWQLSRRYSLQERAAHWMYATLFSPVDLERFRLPAWLSAAYPFIRPISLIGRIPAKSNAVSGAKPNGIPG